ncbi:MAG: hypothetical protein EPN93_06330 [Spirochaetes bacterium]|nr:MAG: hypothetical protein EPN93_06330 [Spirochaetota bacterium]
MGYYERLVYVARNFLEYENYGSNKAKAVKIISRYFPEKTTGECAIDFDSVCEVYKNAIAFARSNSAIYFEWRKTKERSPLDTLEKNFKESQKNVPVKTIDHILGWVYDWHLER